MSVKSFARLMLWTPAVLLALLGGCASSGQSAGGEMAKESVVVTNTHGRVTTYSVTGGKVQSSMQAGEQSCPECDSAAAMYYKTGKLEPTCAACGSTRKVVTGAHGG